MPVVLNACEPSKCTSIRQTRVLGIPMSIRRVRMDSEPSRQRFTPSRSMYMVGSYKSGDAWWEISQSTRSPICFSVSMISVLMSLILMAKIIQLLSSASTLDYYAWPLIYILSPFVWNIRIDLNETFVKLLLHCLFVHLTHVLSRWHDSGNIAFPVSWFWNYGLLHVPPTADSIGEQKATCITTKCMVGWPLSVDISESQFYHLTPKEWSSFILYLNSRKRTVADSISHVKQNQPLINKPPFSPLKKINSASVRFP